MNSGKNNSSITKSVLVICIILILFIMMSCSNSNVGNYPLNVNKTEDTLKELDIPINVNEDKTKTQQQEYKNDKTENFFDMNNTYYGKYKVDEEDVFGDFEITRNSIIFTPNNGASKEIIHFSGIRDIERYDYPNGKIDLILRFDGNEKVIKNVSAEMFSDVLLYTTK